MRLLKTKNDLKFKVSRFSLISKINQMRCWENKFNRLVFFSPFQVFAVVVAFEKKVSSACFIEGVVGEVNRKAIEKK